MITDSRVACQSAFTTDDVKVQPWATANCGNIMPKPTTTGTSHLLPDTWHAKWLPCHSAWIEVIAQLTTVTS